MKFSEREGFVNLDMNMKRKMIDNGLKIRLWNLIYINMIKRIEFPLSDEKVLYLLEKSWDQVFKEDLRSFKRYQEPMVSKLASRTRDIFLTELKWYEIFDFIEEIVKNKNFFFLKDKFNDVLKEEHSPYRIIENCVVEITSEEEIKEIERVFRQEDKFNPTKEHLKKSLDFLSSRDALGTKSASKSGERRHDFPKPIKSACGFMVGTQIR